MKKYLLLLLLLICRPVFADDFTDFAHLVNCWRADIYEGDCETYDYNLDGQIDFGDMKILFSAWTKPSPACKDAECSDCTCLAVISWHICRDCEVSEYSGLCYCGGNRISGRTEVWIGRCCPGKKCKSQKTELTIIFRIFQCDMTFPDGPPCFNPEECGTVGPATYVKKIIPVGAICK